MLQTQDLRASQVDEPCMSKLKVVDFNYFHFLFISIFFLIYFFYSIFRTRDRIRVTRSCHHTSVTLDDMVTNHKMYRRT